MWVLLPQLRPGEAAVIRQLDFLEGVLPPPLSIATSDSLDGGDLRPATTESTSCSDLVLANPDEFPFSIFTADSITKLAKQKIITNLHTS